MGFIKNVGTAVFGSGTPSGISSILFLGDVGVNPAYISLYLFAKARLN